MSKTKPEAGETWIHIGSKSEIYIVGESKLGKVVWQYMDSNRLFEEDIGLSIWKLKVPKKVLYVNVYSTEAVAHLTRTTADDLCRGSDRIARVRVEYEEGQFDE